jgi:proline iminopeptidase
MEDSEGFASVLGYRLYYRSFGAPGRRGVVLGVHGGPGASHDSLLPFRGLTRFGYRVVLFDQLGCGRSDLPEDHALFTLDHNVAETEALRSELKLGRVHLIGTSYGGLLALAFAIRHGRELRSLVTVGGLADVPFAAAEMNRLRLDLPAATQATLARFEARGELQAPEYLAAVNEFYHTFLCRLPTWPPEMNRSLEMCLERPVYGEMNGPNEFTITGTIRDINLVPQLGAIDVPTLVVGGRYDEVTPRVAEQIHHAIPGSRRHTFEQSSHTPYWEEPEEFLRVVGSFLNGVDAAAGR